MNRVIDGAILAGLFIGASYLVGYAYFGAFKTILSGVLP
jgi:hypothetical protein